MKNSAPLTKKEQRDHANQIAEQEREEKKAFDEQCRAKGMKQEKVRAPDGTVQSVWSVNGASFRGFEDHQKRAAQRLMTIWEKAYGGVKSASLEMKVDGGGSGHAVQAVRMEAQQALLRIERALGEFHWMQVKGVVYGLSPAMIHAAGGEQHRTGKAFQRAALDALDAYFTGAYRHDRTLLAIKSLTEQIDRAMREAE